MRVRWLRLIHFPRHTSAAQYYPLLQAYSTASHRRTATFTSVPQQSSSTLCYRHSTTTSSLICLHDLTRSAIIANQRSNDRPVYIAHRPQCVHCIRRASPISTSSSSIMLIFIHLTSIQDPAHSLLQPPVARSCIIISAMSFIDPCPRARTLFGCIREQ